VPNAVLKPSHIDEWVRRRLGSSSVAVELETEDIRQCLLKTIVVYNRWRPQHAHSKLNIVSTQKKYEIDHPGLQGVSSVEFIRQSVVQGHVDPFDPYSVIRTPMTAGVGLTFGEYANQLMYQEDARRIVSTEPEWYGQWEPQTDGSSKYYLYIDVPATTLYECSYKYTWHVTPDNQKLTGMQHIPNGDVDWVLQFTHALAKEPLARIRGKFHGIPMPDGGEEDNDYAELMEESRAETERLEEELRLRSPPLDPVIG